MIQVEIHGESCRGCRICEEICPTKVIGMEEPPDRATVRDAGECIACLSCAYACPANAIRHSGHHVVKNFYRDLQYVRRLEQFL